MGATESAPEIDHLLRVLDKDARPRASRDEQLVAANALYAEFHAIFAPQRGGTRLLRGDPRLPKAIWRTLRVLGLTSAEVRDQLSAWMVDLATDGSGAACNYCGVLRRKAHEWPEALWWFARAGNAGNSQGWFDCGLTVLLRDKAEEKRSERDGEEAPQQKFGVLPDEAVVYFERGAEQGNTQAAFFMSRHWKAVADEETDIAASELARERSKRYVEEAALGLKGEAPTEYAFLDYAKVLRERGRWDEAYRYALTAIDAGPDSLRMSNRFSARWMAARIARDAPPGAIADWVAVPGTIAEFRPILTEREEHTQAFDEILGDVQTKPADAAAYSTTAKLAIAVLPQEFAGVQVRDIFSIDRSKGAEAQRAAFSRILQLLRGGAEDMKVALDLLERLARWSTELQQVGVFHARDVAHDGGLQWLRGQLHYKMGQHDLAIAAFRRSSELKNDEDHIGMCFERIGAIYEEEFRYGEAANAFLKGLQVSRHAGLLIRFAQAKMLERPANNGAAMVKLLKFFVQHQPEVTEKEGPSWTYQGDDPALRGLPPIPVPLDAAPDRTAVKLAAMVRMWAKAVPPDAPRQAYVAYARSFVIEHLQGRIDRRRNPQDFPADLIYALAQYSDTSDAAAYLADLMRQAAEIKQGRGPLRAASHRRNLAQLLESIAGGCSSGEGVTEPVLQAAVAIICVRPELREENFRAALALASLVWRAILGRYANGAQGAPPDQASAFRDWLIAHVIEPIAGIEEEKLRRQWFFELVVGDKASVEYVLSRRLVSAARNLLGPVLTLPSLARVGDWLRTDGEAACHDLASRVLLGVDAWVPECYAAGDTDTGRWAHEMLVSHVKTRLSGSYREARILLSVREEGEGEGLQPLCAVEAASVAMRLTANFFSVPALQALGLMGEVRGVAIKLIADSGATEPLSMYAEITLRESMPYDDLVSLRKRFQRRSTGGHLGFRWHPSRDLLQLEQHLEISSRKPELPKEWLRFLNELKNEYNEFRSSGIALTGFFDSRWDKFPASIESFRSDRAAYCDSWACVFHVVCDRFWALFVDRLVSRQEDDRSVLVLLHGLRAEVQKLQEMNMRTTTAEFKRQLSKVRNSLARLERSADVVLGQELKGWTSSLFDLQGVVQLQVREVFGESAEIPFKADDSTPVVGALRPLSLVLGELLQNARRYGRLENIEVERATEVDWSIAVTTRPRPNAFAISKSHAPRQLGTGQGMLFARALCEDAGFFWRSEKPAPGEPHKVVFGRGQAERGA